MKKGWGIILTVPVVFFLLGGCKEESDHGKEAKAVLKGTVSPGGVRHSGRQLKQPNSPAPHLLQPAQSLQPVPSPGKQKPEMLQKMGIEVGGGRITIDTKRARSYFEALERQISQGVHRGVQKAKQHTSGVDDIGIHVSKEKVEIDLNKTRNFLKVWGESMKIIGEELDRSLKPSP